MGGLPKRKMKLSNIKTPQNLHLLGFGSANSPKALKDVTIKTHLMVCFSQFRIIRKRSSEKSVRYKHRGEEDGY